MGWVLQNSGFLSFVANTLMLLVWVVYLHLFWLNYRRQLRANIVINRGAGTGVDALCLVCNMSAEPVFIEGMIVIADCKGERWATAVTNLSDIVEGRPAREGPMKSGEYVTVGTFRDLLSLADGTRVDPPRIDAIEIWIVADFSSENDLVFARRRFLLAARGEKIVLRPAELETRRISRAGERREVEQVLQEHLEEAVGAGHVRQAAGRAGD